MAIALSAFILAIVGTYLHSKPSLQMTPEEVKRVTEELEKTVDSYTKSEANKKELECWEKVGKNDKEGFKKCMEEWRKLRDEWWEKNK